MLHNKPRKTKSCKRRILLAAATLVLAMLLIMTGCSGGTPAENKPGGNGSGNGSGNESSETPGGEQTVKTGFSSWEDRSMEDIISVGAVTTVTPDLKVYNAADFGIGPDEKKDVSADIKAACDQVIAKGGGVLYFPSGRYTLNTVLEISGDGSWLCLCGDVDGSSKFVFTNKYKEEKGVCIVKENTHLSFMSFEDASKNTVTLSVEADGCSLYGCSFNKTSNKAQKTCVEISGSFDTLRQCSFWAENKETCFVEFTKYPGRDAYGNVICDVHFGGEFAKTLLISSHDEEGVPENMTVFRNLFLLPSDPMIEVRSVNGLVIANNMLDAATRSIGIDPEGSGVFNVEIRDNYMGASAGGVRCCESETAGGNISIHDNYIWSPDGINVLGNNYTDVVVSHNYFVLGGGNALYMTYAKNAGVKGNLVANIGSSEPQLKIVARDESSEIDQEGFGSAALPSKTTEADQLIIPGVPKKTKAFAKRPEITGSVSAPVNKKYVNVKEYGAAGDGVTDDTEAIEKSVKKALAINGTVYFPEGTYLVKQTVSVSKDDSKVLRFKGDGAGLSAVIGDGSLDGSIFDIGLKYNFNMYDLKVSHRGNGSCVDALYVKAFDCVFEGSASSKSPVLCFHGSNCWSVRCSYHSDNPESYAISYTRISGEISINDYIIDNTVSGACKGVLVGNGSTVGEGRPEGLKIIGNTFKNTGKTGVEIYEILHVNIAYNTFESAENAIFLSNLGYGPDGIYIDHNTAKSKTSCVTSGKVEGGSDYISMVVIHDNSFSSDSKEAVTEPVAFNKKMIHDQ